MYGEANAKIFVSLSLLDGEFIKTLSNFCLRCSTNMKSPFYLLLMAARMYKRHPDHSKLCFVFSTRTNTMMMLMMMDVKQRLMIGWRYCPKCAHLMPYQGQNAIIVIKLSLLAATWFRFHLLLQWYIYMFIDKACLCRFFSFCIYVSVFVFVFVYLHIQKKKLKKL